MFWFRAGVPSLMGINLLRLNFSVFFRVAHLKNAKVHEVVSYNGDICHWNLIFVRSLNDMEEDSICSLLAVLARRFCPKTMMTLCSHSTLMVLFSSRVFVPHRWKRWIVGVSLPNPFGSLELLQNFVSLLGRHQKARFLWRTMLKEEILAVQVDALCVWSRQNLWIISFCIVDGFLRFGFISFFNGG